MLLRKFPTRLASAVCRSRSALLSIVVALVLISAVVINARAWFANAASARNGPDRAVSNEAPTAPPQRARPIAQMESELITVTRHGFEPRQITRPQGRFLLLIDNRSGLATVLPRLTPIAGLRLLDLTIPREEPNWSDVLDLQAGVYLLTDASHPAWICRLTITPQ